MSALRPHPVRDRSQGIETVHHRRHKLAENSLPAESERAFGGHRWLPPTEVGLFVESRNRDDDLITVAQQDLALLQYDIERAGHALLLIGGAYAPKHKKGAREYLPFVDRAEHYAFTYIFGRPPHLRRSGRDGFFPFRPRKPFSIKING